MANFDNQCSDLPIDDLYSNSKDTLGDIMSLQKDTQENIYGWHFEHMSLRDIMNFWHVNTHSLTDEIHEATDALGGITNGGNAIWKYWKKDNAKAADMKISDLSESDKLELYYEWIDGLHFFMNFGISMGMTSEDIVNLYMAKQKENHDRQDRGY